MARFAIPARRPHFSVAALFIALVWFQATPAQARVDLQPCSNNVAPAQQIELGRKAAQQVWQQMPVLPDSSPVSRYVRELGAKLAAHAPGYRWPWEFHVVNVEDINAFALPGGIIFVNLGTVQAAETEAQLAAVMAHEISHVVLEHSVCNIEKQQKVGLLAGLGQLAAGIALGSGTLGNLAQQSIGLGAGLGFLKMSRDAERQADLEGVGILYDTGYDPRAMPQFFEIIQGKYGKGGAQFLSDHPNPGNRTEYIDGEIATLPRRDRPVTSTDRFRQIHRTAAGLHPYTAKQVASGVWKSRTPNAASSTGVAQYEQTSTGAAPDLSPPASWNTFEGDGFTLQVPSGWRALGNRTAAMIAPPGGIAGDRSANLVYGVLIDRYTPPQGTPPSQAFTALLNQLTSQNPGLQPVSVTTLEISGQTAQSVQSVLPSANNGRGEQDWLIGIPAGDAVRYFVFVAPEPDFNTLRPVFEHMLSSIRLR